MYITNNVSNELNVHTEGCSTTYKVWKTLKGMFETPSQQDYTEQLCIIFETRATKGTNILDHLTKLKQTWNKVHIFSKKCKLLDDVLFKHIIVSTLPLSWDKYTRPYVQGCIDKTNKDLNRHIDSQALIRLIKQKYKADESHRKKEAVTSKNGNGNCNNGSCSNANHNNSSSNNNYTPCEKKHCNHCGRDGHYTCKCHYLDKPKCNKCSKFSHVEKDCYSKPSNKCAYSSKDKEGANKHSKCKANNVEANNANNASNSDMTAKVNIVIQGDDESVGEHEVIQGKYVTMNAEEKANTREKDAYDNNREYFNKTPLFNENRDLVYDWLADSRMTSHIMHRCEAFATYEPIERTPIKGVSSVKAYAIGMGTVFLNSKCDRKVHTIKLRDVLHVPNNQNNLLTAGNWEQCG